jgi:hypothetical protein
MKHAFTGFSEADMIFVSCGQAMYIQSICFDDETKEGHILFCNTQIPGNINANRGTAYIIFRNEYHKMVTIAVDGIKIEDEIVLCKSLKFTFRSIYKGEIYTSINL